MFFVLSLIVAFNKLPQPNLLTHSCLLLQHILLFDLGNILQQPHLFRKLLLPTSGQILANKLYLLVGVIQRTIYLYC